MGAQRRPPRRMPGAQRLPAVAPGAGSLTDSVGHPAGRASGAARTGPNGSRRAARTATPFPLAPSP